MKAQKLNRRQARWALYLSRFNFMLKHVPGSKMGKADSLNVTVVLWTSSHILYGLSLYQKGDVSKATC